MMPMIGSTATVGAYAATTSGNSGKQKRRSPYPPILSSTPASMTLPAVGASTCASGSQVWNGKIGTLTANPTNNRMNAIPPSEKMPRPYWPKSNRAISGMPNVSGFGPKYATRKMPTSMNAEPANVNRMNLKAAYSRRAPPQMPMIRNIGISSSSQNRKNKNRSAAVNTPATADSRMRNRLKYSGWRMAIRHEPAIALRVSSAFS